MRRRTVYVVYGDGEETLAEALARPLREAGYDVAHHGTVAVGESLIGEAASALASNSPIVLCATVRAVGSAWAHQIVHAAQADGRVRVFVIQMEAQAYVEQLSLKSKVARYCHDPAQAIRELLDALAKHFPPQVEEAHPAQAAPANDTSANHQQFLDQPAESATLDFEALARFRSQLREEARKQYPAALTPWEFLDRNGLRKGGMLTRTGALLFAGNLVEIIPAAVVKCTQYYGSDRAAPRDSVTFSETVPDQIEAARDFVADRVRGGEAPSANQAQSTDVYDYPMIAVREFIANALVHRDYLATDRCVHVRLFTERLEVSSPGDWLSDDDGLVDGAEHNMADLVGQSIKRNFRLAHTLYSIKLVEADASGIPAALHDCRVARSPEPMVVQRQGFVTVTLRRRDPGRGQPQGGQWQALVPMTIPADIGYYTGRAAELAELDTMLPDAPAGGTPATRVSLITGTAGVGKTVLAVHWAHRVRDRFPDGQLYVNLRSVDPGRPPVTPAEAVRSFVDALGTPPERIPADLDGLVRLYRSLMHNRRMLVVLDDAGTADQIRPLLPGGSACTVIITSRNRLSSLVARDGARALRLGLLSYQEAREFLVRRLGRDRVEAEPEASDVLVERCARLPLALAIAAARAAASPHLTLSTLAAELSDASNRLDALSIDDNLDVSVRAVFASSYRDLTASAAHMFRLLGVHPGPDIGFDAAVSLSGLGPASARQPLVELTSRNLLDEPVHGRYRLHSLLRAYAAECAAEEATELDVSEAVSRVADYYLHTGIAAAARLNPHRESITVEPPSVAVRPIDSYEQAMDWFTAEDVALLTVIDYAAQAGLDQHAWRLAWAIGPFLDLRRNWKALIAAQQTALAAAERLSDPAAEAASHRFLARAYNRLDNDEEAVAHNQRAMALFRELDDRNGQANTLYDLAELHALQGRHAQAIGSAMDAMELYEAIGDASGANDAAELVRTMLDRHPVPLSDAIRARLSRRNAKEWGQTAPRPLAVHRTIFVADVAGFADRSRTDRSRLAVRDGLYRALRDAFTLSGISWDLCHHEDRGDGVFIAAPPSVPKQTFVDTLLDELARRLHDHNRTHPQEMEIRLRIAVHAGEVHFDDHGVAGTSINLAFRLLDAPALKSALVNSAGAPLALITSQWFYEEVVRHSTVVDPAAFRAVRVRVKETVAMAWISLPDPRRAH